MQYNIIQYNTMPYNALQCNTIDEIGKKKNRTEQNRNLFNVGVDLMSKVSVRPRECDTLNTQAIYYNNVFLFQGIRTGHVGT